MKKKTILLCTMLLGAMLIGVPKTNANAAIQVTGYTIPFGTDGVPTLQEIEADEMATDDAVLIEEEDSEEVYSDSEENVTSQIITYSANGTTVKYHFIDTTGSGGGDATLIEASNRYYLVDGGPERGITRLKKYLSSHCKKKNGKIEI